MYTEITTIEQVFDVLKLDPNVKPDVTCWPERDRVHKTHEFYVHMAIDAVNEGWVPNWNDTTEQKWFIGWDIIAKPERASGRGLSVGGVSYDYVFASVGPRLVFKSADHARHFAKYFLSLMESYYLGD